jgi:hypothetical protein
MIDLEHRIADKILEELDETVNSDEKERLLTQYQRICQASKDRAESDLMTYEICEKLENEGRK